MVAPAIIGAGIAAGASIGGGLLGNRAAERQQNINWDKQKTFAKKAIQWKVEDAKKAGLHPLFALGANTNSFNPISVGDSMGPALQQAGQDISRAMYANSDSQTRGDVKIMGALALEKAGLENDLLRAQIAKLSGQVGPPVPTAAQSLMGGPQGIWESKPAEVVTSRPGASHIQAGPEVPAFQGADFGPFKLNLLSPTVSEQLEDMELLKYALMYSGNKSQVDDYFLSKAEPYFENIWRTQQMLEALPGQAESQLREWADTVRAKIARARLPKHRGKAYWKN